MLWNKFAYRHDSENTATAITPSTKKDDKNSINTRYTCGEVTKASKNGSKIIFEKTRKS